jgi:transcriptional regulator with XRE-family HTH domain
MSIFSEKLRKLRKERDYTQKVLSKEIGISLRQYAKYESGNLLPPIEKIKQLSDILDFNFLLLIADSDEAKELKKEVESDGNLLYTIASFKAIENISAKYFSKILPSVSENDFLKEIQNERERQIIALSK